MELLPYYVHVLESSTTLIVNINTHKTRWKINKKPLNRITDKGGGDRTYFGRDRFSIFALKDYFPYRTRNLTWKFVGGNRH